MKREFRLNPDQLQRLKNAARQPPYIVAGGIPPPPIQDYVNRVWEQLGHEMGFVWGTAEPVPGKDETYFTADVV